MIGDKKIEADNVHVLEPKPEGLICRYSQDTHNNPQSQIHPARMVPLTTHRSQSYKRTKLIHESRKF